MERIITIVLLALTVILAVANLICLSRIKSKGSYGQISLDEKDKKDITDAFSSNVRLISSVLESSNARANDNLKIRLEGMNEKLEKRDRVVAERLEAMERSQAAKLESIRVTLERNVAAMQESNEKKLNEIKRTVDEKLTETLNERFKESFKFLSEELEKVGKTVGEMQNISKDVVNLTKVLSNVKTTGIFGEIQLGAIIEQILSPEQYLKNVVTNKSGRDPVEFAIKMPGGDDGEVLLPIDSKFPFTVYNDMVSAYNENDFALFELKKREMVQRVKGMAKDIKEKYICPPYTTNFAVMFLPVEGLYAEVVKLGLVEELQSKYSVTVAGPTTMAALLNSLQMGFQTLAIQKKTNEVWRVLSSVKTEFGKFNEILTQIQNRLNMANNDLDKLIGVRTRAIARSLKNIEVSETESERLTNDSVNAFFPSGGGEEF
ncbi:MAG: DNA recombination protein RmuC [Candidatus Borkfalkiaceae bacterium]|nr:DNA recombination protein RmuC [Christensenellaceae bacterium]